MKSQATHSVLTRLRAVVLAAIALIAGLTARAETVEIATAFPDAYFQYYIKNAMYIDNADAIAAAKGSIIPESQYDANGNPFSSVTSLTDAQLALITDINLNREHTNIDASVADVSELTGIQNFTNLQKLFCDNHALTSLDVSNLTNLRVLSARHNQIASINVAHCSHLQSVALQYNNLHNAEIVDKLVYGLPTYGTEGNSSTLKLYGSAYNYVYDDEYGEYSESSYPDSVEANAGIREEMVKVLSKKGWQVMKSSYSAYYESGEFVYEDYYEDTYTGNTRGTNPIVLIDETNFPDEHFRNYIKYFAFMEPANQDEFSANKTKGYPTNTGSSNQTQGLEEDYDFAAQTVTIGGVQQTYYNPFHNAHYLTKQALECFLDIYLDRNTVQGRVDGDHVISDLTGVNRFTNLEKLFCDGHEITSLDVSGLTKLHVLKAHDNHLTKLNITGCESLQSISIYDNNFTREYLTDSVIFQLPRYRLHTTSYSTTQEGGRKSPNMEHENPTERCQLHLYNTANGRTNADVYASVITWLTKFKTWAVTEGTEGNYNYDYTGLAEEPFINIAEDYTDDIPDEYFRKYLRNNIKDRSENSVWFPNGNPGYDKKLTIGEIRDIRYIYPFAYNGTITTLEGIKHFRFVEKINLGKIEDLDSYTHQLTSLDVSGMKYLNTIWVEHNQLTSINVEGCDKLQTVCLVGNYLDEAAMQQLINDLPDRSGVSWGSLRVKYIDKQGSYQVSGGNTYTFNPTDYIPTEYSENQNVITNIQRSFAEKKIWEVKMMGNSSGWKIAHMTQAACDAPTVIHINGYTVPDETLLRYICNNAYEDNKETINAAVAAGKYYNRGKELGKNPFYFDRTSDKARDDNGKLKGIDLYIDDVAMLRYLNLDKFSDPDRPGYVGEYRPIADLTGVKLFTSLEQIHAPYHHLTNVDVSGMPKLRILRLHSQAEGYKLQSLNVGTEDFPCDSLWQIYADDNDLNSTGIDFTYTPNLRMLRINNNPQIGLQEVGGSRPGIDLSQNKELEHLDIYNCHLKELDVTNNPNLKVLYCYETRDGEADDDGGAGGSPTISSPATINGTSEDVGLDGKTRRGEITTLDLSNNKELVELRCSNNPLSDLNLSNNPLLEILYVNSIDMMTSTGMNGTTNMLQKNLQYTPALKQLSCYNANLDALDVSLNPKLWELICYKNNIKWLNLAHNPDLTYLSTGEAQATAARKAGEDHFDARRALLPEGGNPIRRLDVSALDSLKTLHCAQMQLTDLNLSSNAALKDLDYQIQERTIQAEVADHRQIENGKVVHYNVYYLRMDERTDDNGLLLTNRIADSDYNPNEETGLPLGYAQSSTFVIAKLMDNYSGSLSNGGVLIEGSRTGDGTVPTSGPRRTPASPDQVDQDAIIGKVLVLTNVTETSEQATGTVNYQYDISLNENVDPAINKETEFTLKWYAILENGDPIITAVTDLTAAGEVESVTYVNPSGQVATTPWTGINLVITRYTNGTSTTEKRLF